MTDLHHLRELSERASKGPWTIEDYAEGQPREDHWIAAYGGICNLADYVEDVDAAFIVAAVNYVREMLAKAPSAGEGQPDTNPQNTNQPGRT